MGQQQLMLIVIGMVIVAITVVVGIWMMKVNAVEHNRDTLTSYLTHIAVLAQAYYHNPKEIGGGGRSFVGFTISPQDASTDDGTFAVTEATPVEAAIQALGVEIGADGTSPTKIVIVVRSDSLFVDMSRGYN